MHSPRTLILSIAATGCGFLLALVAVIGQASPSAPPAAAVALAPGIVTAGVQDERSVPALPFTLALDPAPSHTPGR